MTATNTAEKIKPVTTTVPADSTDVSMIDGRIVTFAGKRRVIKEILIDEATGQVQVRLDFKNGETRLFTVPESMKLQFAGHGAAQKLGDVYAGTDNTEDAVQAVDELIEQLYDGKWVAERAPGERKASTGGSSLMKALMEVSGKSREEITAFLSKKSTAEKNAIKLSSKIAPVFQKFEAARLAKSGADGEGQLEELGI